MVRTPPVRMAELLAALSLMSDLASGLPVEHALRQCLIASRLAQVLELDEASRDAVYHAGLMAWIGCHVDAYEQAKWFGDDAALKADFRRTDFTSPRADAGFMLRHMGAGRSVAGRVRTAFTFALDRGMADAEGMLATHWRAADELAAGLGFDGHVRTCIEQTFERWDGRGAPHGVRGDEIAITARLVNLADVVDVYHELGGVDAAVAVARERAGSQFDPGVVEAFCAHAADVLGPASAPGWTAVMASEPGLAAPLDDDGLDRALEAIADFTDAKLPYAAGHSRRVADLAANAGDELGLAGDAVIAVRRAGLVHDLGQLGVANQVWDTPGPLPAAGLERMRLHPHFSERALAAAPGLAPVAAVAVLHHERVDGSGYPRGVRGDAIGPEARLLAAADVYTTRREGRPHRDAGSGSDAAAVLREEVGAGRLDGDAVDAVLRATGHPTRRRRHTGNPAGLTPREVEVLRLLAIGRSTKQIAHELQISRKTAGNHVEHVYTKIGVNNRALASLAAVRFGLVDPDDDPPSDVT
jgi:HD-GYP domain-containing protein (c-di-GMP phosphodiesterase class II)